jgi:hypothetical protein
VRSAGGPREILTSDVEASRLFVSFGSNRTGNSAVGQDESQARRSQPNDDVAGGDTPPTGTGADTVEPPAAPAVGEWPVDEWDGPEDFRFAVRPYTWTRGRTRPLQDLAVETLISTSDEGREGTANCAAEHAAIAELCTDIRSVAEVAALLALPLGVARVLLADMIETGLMRVHRNPMDLGGAPDFFLLERVLAGLYRL